MDKLVIEGGHRLKGTVEISGAKNAALPLMAASLLASGVSRPHRLPGLVDIKTMGKLLEKLGARLSYSDSLADIDTCGVNVFEAPYELVKTMRASVLVLGPLVARYGKAKVSLPGGCAIGARPIDLHLMGLEKMGAKVKLEGGYVLVKAKRLKGAKIYFDIPTVTGTENLMMAASLAKGVTVLENAAREPEVVNLAGALISMGAKIKGAGESVVEIEGVDELRPFDYEVIPDRIEAGTFMAAAAVTEGEITLKGADSGHLDAVMLKFKESGVTFKENAQGIKVSGPDRLVSNNIRTMPYPGFPTDMQAQFMAMMSMAGGTSIIEETVFENRFMHVQELQRMGADIKLESNTAICTGVKKLTGAPVMATDLRASASLVIAALIAEGDTLVDRIYHIDRGYDHIEEKLTQLGATIRRVPN